MKKKVTQPQELAALHALGALEGAEEQALAALLNESADARSDAQAFSKVAEALLAGLPPVTPSADLKERILQQARTAQARSRARAAIQRVLPRAQGGLVFLKQPADSDWTPLVVPGAFVKLLSFDEASGYAVVLGKLDPGARYPGHAHQKPEDLFMISGDLHIGDEIIRAGDFHHAEAGSKHGVNWSEQGCVLIAVLSQEDLLAQLVPG